MKKELEQKIIDIAPWLFRYENWNDLTKSLMAFGFSHGDGWFEIVKELTEKLKEIDINKEIRVVQIKEKYASLRWYIEIDSVLEDRINELYDQANKLIAEAELKSEKTCEICGQEGIVKDIGGRWYKTLCNKCFDERKHK
jgi:hypothetical protein